MSLYKDSTFYCLLRNANKANERDNGKIWNKRNTGVNKVYLLYFWKNRMEGAGCAPPIADIYIPQVTSYYMVLIYLYTYHEMSQR